MNIYLPYFASMAVGGLIGYSTNWIAIKMLFRPLKEVRFLGFKVPFTPGVVPKQHKALSINIGNTVEGYLLTHESLKETINSDEFKDKMQNFLNSYYLKLKDTDITIGYILKKSNIKSDKAYKLLYNTTLNNRSELVKVIDSFCNLIADQSRSISLNYFLNEDKSGFEEKLKNTISIHFEKLSNKLHQDTVENNLKLEDLLNEDIKNNMESLILNNIEVIIEAAKTLLSKEETIQIITDIIRNFLSESLVGNLIKSIVPKETLTEIVVKNLKDKLNDASTAKEIESLTPSLLNYIYKIKIENVFQVIDGEKMILTKYLAEYLSSKILLEVSMNKSIQHYLDFLEFDLKNYTRIFLIEKFDKITLNEDSLKCALNPLLSKIANIKINNIFLVVENKLEQLLTFFATLLSRVVEIYGEDILETLDIKKLVENQINRLDLIQVEEIILGVMNNQLKAITWFGLLLGALLGLMMPHLNNILS